MASLNWVMLSPTHEPIPLPSEKILVTLSSISLSLFPCPPGAGPNAKPSPPDSELKADRGTLYASNKRVIFVADQGKKKVERAVESLSVPWESYVDGRYVQPWFGATYYEALCLPNSRSPNESGISAAHLCRLYFNESGGYQFYELVEEMKARLEASASGRGTPVEALPLYEPPSKSSAGGGPGPSPLAASTAASDSSSTFQEPGPDDLEAARIAQEAQKDEADQAARALHGGAGNRRGAEDGPPGYEA